MLEELEAERKWDKAFADSEDILDRLADEALEANKQGKTKPLNINSLWNPWLQSDSGSAMLTYQPQ